MPINRNSTVIHESHGNVPYHESAIYRFTKIQLAIILLTTITFAFGLVVDWKLALTVFIAVITVFYAADLLFNLLVISRSLKKSPEIIVSDEELNDKTIKWPMYTILCPLYKEGKVLRQFISAMENLDYPIDRLQIMLLLEEDDRSTIALAKEMQLPKQFEIIIVPPSLPKTKPKACNYGLKVADGDFIVIYDAEDVPEPHQLKKAYIAFSKSKRKLACIQCKLNFYNPYTNFLTRAFTSEYALWFNLILPGLQSVDAPIPLGGTSNHFKTYVLRNLGGWDAYNVTEDADLGIRIVKRGYSTAIVDSTTLEEANAMPGNWFWQRTRWVKGYYQTYFVHTRNLKLFGKSTFNTLHSIMFQIVIGGKTMSMLINPIMWILTLIYVIFHTSLGNIINEFYPAPILYMAVFSLIFGNFLYMYYYMIGSARREDYSLVKYAFLAPIYWLAMSAAAYYALYELIRKPHKWRKTAHGINLQKPSEGLVS